MDNNLQFCLFRPAQWDLLATKMMHNHIIHMVKKSMDFVYLKYSVLVYYEILLHFMLLLLGIEIMEEMSDWMYGVNLSYNGERAHGVLN